MLARSAIELNDVLCRVWEVAREELLSFSSATSESCDYPDAEFERLRICFSAGKLEKRLSDAGTFETLFPMRIVNGGPFCTEAKLACFYVAIVAHDHVK
jgi:hypothetical protein